MNGRSPEDVQALKVPYDTIMAAARHYTFVQTRRMHTTKTDPSRKLRTWCDNDVSMWFISSSKWAVLVGDVGAEGM